MKRILKGIVRWFVLITGFIPYIFYLKPRFVYESAQAKKDFKKQRKGVIYIANHTKILDYYLFLFKKCPRKVHALVGEIVYEQKGLSFLNDVMGNIRVDRLRGQNTSAIRQAQDLLDRNKIVLIFPEGKLEEKPGILENFTKSFAYLSLSTGKPIIPFYLNGKYGFFKRPRVIVGEAIYPKVLSSSVIEESDIDELCAESNDKVRKLGTICRDHLKHRTKTLLTLKYWLLDFTRITSMPWFYLIFPTRRYFQGNRKEIRRVLRYNALICSNHCGMCDCLYIFFYFLWRRVRILTAHEVWANKFLGFVLDNSGMIKYHRSSDDAFDLNAFKESVSTLNGRGVMTVFPEGHINFDGSFDKEIKAGAAAMSLMTNTPIVPFIFVTPFKYFCFNKVVYGKPIYPSDYAEKFTGTKAENINIYNEIIYSKMKELYDYALSKRSKNFAKKTYFKDNSEPKKS